MNEYQAKCGATVTYRGPSGIEHSLENIEYCTLGLCGEAGEIANKVKKLYRDGDTKERREAITLEIGDVLWYTAMLAYELQVLLGDCAEENLTKLMARKFKGTIHGDGDHR
jgi:NTP pyrophosphatase (non-canonical NTP hydrolase)